MTAPGGEKPKLPPWRELIRHVGQTIALTWSVSPGVMFYRIGTAVLQGILPLADAYIAGQVINALVHLVDGSGTVQTVFGYLFIGTALLLFQRSLWEFGSYAEDKFDLYFDQELDRRLFSQILRLDQSYYEDGEFTTLLNKVRENLYALSGLVTRLTSLLSATISLVTSAAVLVVFNPFLLVIVGVVVIPLTLVELRQNKQMSQFWDTASDRWRLVGYFRWTMFNSFPMLKELKLYRADRRFLDRLLDARWKLDWERLTIRRRRQIGTFLVTLLGVATDLGIQIWLVLKVAATRGAFGVGDFQFYRGVIQNFGSSVNSIASEVSRLQESLMYIGDYYTLMSFEPRLKLPSRGHRLSASSIPAIGFDHVTFRYPKAKRAVLHDVSFSIEPGEHVAIVGENGAGKSTLLKLLMRLYDPSSGAVLLDGRPLPDIALESWYAQLGFLFQDFSQFGPLTLRENVTLGVQSGPAAAKRLARSLYLADAHKFVAGLPQGVEQVLDPSYKGGTELSGGQWQRVALARSFYLAPNVLILDEPTSAIDAAAEYAIFNRLFKQQEGKSMVIISHRFSTVRRADRIVVLDQGKIVEQGTHQELMKLGGKYQQLFTLQAEGYTAE